MLPWRIVLGDTASSKLTWLQVCYVSQTVQDSRDEWNIGKRKITLLSGTNRRLCQETTRILEGGTGP